MEAGWAVTGFAPGVERIGSGCNQSCVVSRGKILVDFVVALLTFLRSNVGGARDHGEFHHGAMHGGAGNNCGQQGSHPKTNRQSSAPSCEQLSNRAEVAIFHESPDVVTSAMRFGSSP
jgi:hypothetical protein